MMVVRGVFCGVFHGLLRTAILNMSKALEMRLTSNLSVNKKYRYTKQVFTYLSCYVQLNYNLWGPFTTKCC